jgi:hypothetical protein
VALVRVEVGFSSWPAPNRDGGARLYRDGPFPKGKPELGYQLALTPREFFRAGVAAANAWTRKTYGKDFLGWDQPAGRRGHPGLRL